MTSQKTAVKETTIRVSAWEATRGQDGWVLAKFFAFFVMSV